MSHYSPNQPYLTQFATQRSPRNPIEGWYSHETEMWMVDTASGPRPAIEHKSSELEMATKTAVQSESDDDIALELLTKTEVQQEQDDEDPPPGLHLY